MKKQFIKTLSAVILLIGAFIVLSGCEGNKYCLLYTSDAADEL